MNGTTLKITALALMLIDHLHMFLPGIPVWFSWLGRLSAPIFFFCMAWGLQHTRNRPKYLLRFYLWGIGMAVADILLCVLFPVFPENPPYNNTFVTLLLSAFICTIIDHYRRGEKKTGGHLLIIFIVVQLLSFFFTYAVLVSPLDQFLLLYLLPSSLFPSILFCEGGPFWVILGVVLYYIKGHKLRLSLFYIAFSFVVGPFLFEAATVQSVFYENYQWMMVFALPFLLCYNGQKGRGFKWLFYIFYPAHIYTLFIIGVFIAHPAG